MKLAIFFFFCLYLTTVYSASMRGEDDYEFVDIVEPSKRLETARKLTFIPVTVDKTKKTFKKFRKL
uniref:U49-Sparatoxin-Hju1a_2 n=1 Tax=Heteropoda jugulans TaxID=1358901 RepID=A0A4Q8K938_9ARAC